MSSSTDPIVKYREPSSPAYAPNPERKHSRGFRGKVTTGITDLQVAFDVDAEKDNHYARRQRMKKKDRERRDTVKFKNFENRGFRGKIKEGMRGEERTSFMKKKANQRRVMLGIGGRSKKDRKNMKKTSTLEDRPYDLVKALANFKRTGSVPEIVDLNEIRSAPHNGIDGRALKRMISAMLVRAGIEENPGPLDPPKDKEKCEIKPAPVVKKQVNVDKVSLPVVRGASTTSTTSSGPSSIQSKSAVSQSKDLCMMCGIKSAEHSKRCKGLLCPACRSMCVYDGRTFQMKKGKVKVVKYPKGGRHNAKAQALYKSAYESMIKPPEHDPGKMKLTYADLPPEVRYKLEKVVVDDPTDGEPAKEEKSEEDKPKGKGEKKEIPVHDVLVPVTKGFTYRTGIWEEPYQKFDWFTWVVFEVFCILMTVYFDRGLGSGYPMSELIWNGLWFLSFLSLSIVGIVYYLLVDGYVNTYDNTGNYLPEMAGELNWRNTTPWSRWWWRVMGCGCVKPKEPLGMLVTYGAMRAFVANPVISPEHLSVDLRIVPNLMEVDKIVLVRQKHARCFLTDRQFERFVKKDYISLTLLRLLSSERSAQILNKPFDDAHRILMDYAQNQSWIVPGMIDNKLRASIAQMTVDYLMRRRLSNVHLGEAPVAQCLN